MEKLKSEKIKRHIANLLIFTGFWHTKFWWKGERKLNKKSIKTSSHPQVNKLQ